MLQQLRFDGKLLVLGCGSVAQCTIPLLVRHLDMPAERVTVIDMRDNREWIASSLARGVKFVQERLTHDKFREQLGRYLGPGDILIDLAWNLQTTDLLAWCRENGVRYINPGALHRASEFTVALLDLKTDDLKWLKVPK